MLHQSDFSSPDLVVRAGAPKVAPADPCPVQSSLGGGECRQAEGAQPLLGIKRKEFHPSENTPYKNNDLDKSKKPSLVQSIRRDAHADQRQAVSIWWSYRNKGNPDWYSLEQGCHDVAEQEDLAGRGVTMCGWTQIAGVETEQWRTKTEHGMRSFLTGRQMCGLRWVCPVCQARKAEEDRAFVNAGLAGARKRGLFPVMLTLTTRHSKRDTAKGVLAGIKRAEQRLKRLKCWERLPFAGYARVLEWTYGKSGHHPHFHTILLMSAETEEEAIEAVWGLQPSYMDQLQKAGRDGKSKAAWDHSFQVQGAAAAARYITDWGSAEELTGAQKKAANGEGLTPWQLLRLSRTEVSSQVASEHAARWFEIVQATKGSSQLYKSSGFKEIAQAWLDEQPEPDEPQEEPELVYSFGTRNATGASSAWSLAREKTVALREAAENASDLIQATKAVEQALYGRSDAQIYEADAEPEPVVIETCG